MISTIESVTLGITRLEPALHLFRDQLGLKVVQDTRASVGLLSAWKLPVHESVRLLDLANGTSSAGRIRLAFYEDGTRDRGGHEAHATPIAPLTVGPKAVDFRHSGSLIKGATADGLPVWLPTSEQLNAKSGADISALWLITADPAASTQFYCEIFGFITTEAPALTDADRQHLCRLLNAPTNSNLHVTSLRAADDSNIKVMLVHFPAAEYCVPDHPMRPGWPGFNLISLRCDEFDTLIERFEELGIEPVTAPTHVGLPIGRPGRVMLVRGPNQELFEFTEIAA